MFRKIIVNIQNIFFFKCLEWQLRDCKTVLDVGCGYDSALGHIQKTFKSEGIEIYPKTLSLSKKRKLHDVYRLGDIRKLNRFYKRKSFDAAVSIDVIEHLKKNEAIAMIKMMETIATKRVILLTPNGFYKQEAYDGNPYQIHKSGWVRSDLEKLGYKVYGLRGLRVLRTEHAGIRYKPYFFWGFVSLISEILFFFHPDVCFDLFAVKEV